jgi:hypothetical protein
MSFVRFPRNTCRTHRMNKISVLAAAVFALAATAAHSLPVIPGAAGFGIDTPAGRGGTVFRVTNLNATGSGSLYDCVNRDQPRVCIFEVSGTIRLTADMMVRYGRLTIAGQTAPSPGISIRGGAFRIQNSDILIQHIRSRVGDDPNGPDPANRDAFKIEGSDAKPVKNVVIDHCTFSWAIDEVASVWGPHDNITFSNNIFSEALNQSLHETDDGKSIEPHGFGLLIGSVATGGRVSVIGNLFAHMVERNPLSRAREFVFVNNVVYDRGTMDLDLQSQNGRITKSSVVGNVFLHGPSYSRDTRPIYLRTNGSLSMVQGARVYIHDNLAPSDGTTLASMMVMTGGNILSGLLQTSSAPVWNTGLTARSTAGNAVYNRVLAYAGARPTDRDSVDKRVIQSVKDRSGQIINCVAANGSTRCQKNAGGWPTLAQHTRKLTLPSNANSIASNGYSNLENWLHSMDLQLQGVTSSQSPTSPAALSVQ